MSASATTTSSPASAKLNHKRSSTSLWTQNTRTRAPKSNEFPKSQPQPLQNPANAYPIFKLGSEITAEQQAFFNKHGFIHFRQALEPELVQNIKARLDDAERELLDAGRVKINGVPLKFGADESGNPRLQRVPFTNLLVPQLQSLINGPLIAPLTSLIENGRVGHIERDGLVYNHYINTPNSNYKDLGWHTDALRDVFYFQKVRPQLNVGLHLDDSPAKFGGLRLLPGTHNQSVFQILFRKKYFIDTRPDRREVAVSTLAGDITVHDGRLWHRAEAPKAVEGVAHRRVMYFPVINGPYKPKSENSPTPLYLRLMKGTRSKPLTVKS